MSLVAMGCVLVASRLWSMEPADVPPGAPLMCAIFSAIAVYMFTLLLVAGNVMSEVNRVSAMHLRKLRHAKACKRSAEGLGNLETHPIEYLRRSALVLQPLRFDVAGLYYMETNAKLTLANFFLTGTADLLLAFGDG